MKIDEALRIANTLIEAKDVIKEDLETDIAMQSLETILFLAEKQVSGIQ